MSEYIKPIDMPRIGNALQTVERLLPKAFPDASVIKLRLELYIKPNTGNGSTSYSGVLAVETDGHARSNHVAGPDPDVVVTELITDMLKVERGVDAAPTPLAGQTLTPLTYKNLMEYNLSRPDPAADILVHPSDWVLIESKFTDLERERRARHHEPVLGFSVIRHDEQGSYLLLDDAKIRPSQNMERRWSGAPV